VKLTTEPLGARTHRAGRLCRPTSLYIYFIDKTSSSCALYEYFKSQT